MASGDVSGEDVSPGDGRGRVRANGASLGLDVGGSKCRYAWWPAERGPGGGARPAQPAVDGIDATVDAMADAIAAARASAGGAVPDAVVCALAGVGTPMVREAVQTGLRARVGDAAVHVVGDTLAAAAAALRDGPGLLLWSGTGSFCIARGQNGELVRETPDAAA